MRRIFIPILLWAALGVSLESQMRQDYPADRAAIQAVPDAHRAAWTHLAYQGKSKLIS
jgi:hypothetical protein